MCETRKRPGWGAKGWSDFNGSSHRKKWSISSPLYIAACGRSLWGQFKRKLVVRSSGRFGGMEVPKTTTVSSLLVTLPPILDGGDANDDALDNDADDIISPSLPNDYDDKDNKYRREEGWRISQRGIQMRSKDGEENPHPLCVFVSMKELAITTLG